MADIRIKRTPNVNSTSKTLYPGELALAHKTIWFGPFENSSASEQQVEALALANSVELEEVRLELVDQINTTHDTLDTKIDTTYNELNTTIDTVYDTLDTKIDTTGVRSISQSSNGVLNVNANGLNSTLTVYELPQAAHTTLGGVLIPYRTNGIATPATTTVFTNNVTLCARQNTDNRYYGVECDSQGRLYVNIPWTDSDTKQTWGQLTGASSTAYYLMLSMYGASSNSDRMETYTNFKIQNDILYVPKINTEFDGGEWL